MNKRLNFIFGFGPALFSTVLFAAAAVGSAADGRYIIVAEDMAAMKVEAQNQGGVFSHELKYSHGKKDGNKDGFVVHMSANAAAFLKSRFQTALIEEDLEAHTFGKPAPVQPAQITPWGIRDVKAPDAFPTTRGAGVTVCVVDTGIQPNHPDLAANIVGGENFVLQKGTVDPSKWADDNGHGTHVSGTIAALDNSIGVIGAAPDAKLFAAKVLDRNGSGYLSAVADGVRSCIANGAKVINMSLGGSADSSLLHNAIIDAKNAGLVIVAAAGNSGVDVSTSFPAAYAEVIAVSAVDSNLNIAYFSNFGTKIQFSAPGVGVQSTYKGSTYATLNGTSMASPHVAGVAALMISTNSLGLLGRNIGLTSVYQGSSGFIDALATVLNK